MSQSRIVSMVLFVLGLVLIGVGTSLSNVSETGMTTRGPWLTYPYLSAGAAVIIIGTVVLAVAYLMIVLKKAVFNDCRDAKN